MKQTEKKCQNDVIKYYKAKGYQILKTMGGFQGSYSTPEGGPDLILFSANGDPELKTMFIEVKSETGKLRDSQIVKINELLKLNYSCGIARPQKEKPYFKLERLGTVDMGSELEQAKANLERVKALKKKLSENIKYLKQTKHIMKLGENSGAPETCEYSLKCKEKSVGRYFDIAYCDRHMRLMAKNDFKLGYNNFNDKEKEGSEE